MSILPPGSKLGRFEISSVLGQGAMGVVYLAHDPQIERPVAIKTIHPEAARGESAAEVEARFLKEAKLAGRLQHPNIVTVYDVGRDKDLYFIAMEYVEGKPLSRFLGGREELPLTAKVTIIRQAAEALAHAHERDVVHRDIKPGNILITRDGRVKVTDFGIGKFTSATASDMTRTGQMIGSPAYMSPEQIRGEKVDGRSDLFSLGVVLYELLTGARPFPGESITTLVYQILHTEPRDPREIRSDLPLTTREVMARLLAKQPDRRPPDAHEFIRELRRIEKFQRESEMTRRAVAAGPAAPAGEAVGSAAAPPPVPAASVPAPAPPPEPASSGAPTAPAARPNRRILEGTIFLLAGAAIAGGLLFFLVFRKPRTVSGPLPLASLPTPASAPAVPTPPAPAPEVVPAEPAPVVLPSPGPAAAGDATVGASRLAGTPVPRPTRPRPSPAPIAEPPKVAAARLEAEAPPPAPAAAPARPPRVDAVYETRGSVRFTSSPEQARLYLDGRYVGIADDWDNRGGGRPLELEKEGTHYVRMELPGYRPLNLQIDVTPDADDSVSIDEELDRRERVPYEKLPTVSDRTTSEVEFAVTPADAGISEDGKALGLASEFGPGSPLKLSGPMVHDLMLSAPGHRPKLVRILVAPNAGKTRAKVTEKLKPQ
jgi:eukaryotic-like serine/threonine-protein kinase